jgi:hypothetical protein
MVIDAPPSYHTRKKMTVKMAEAVMMQTMPVTTADVAACPTAAALRPHCMPRRHPASATSMPTLLLIRLRAKALRVSGRVSGSIPSGNIQHGAPDQATAQDP